MVRLQARSRLARNRAGGHLPLAGNCWLMGRKRPWLCECTDLQLKDKSRYCQVLQQCKIGAACHRQAGFCSRCRRAAMQRSSQVECVKLLLNARCPDLARASWLSKALQPWQPYPFVRAEQCAGTPPTALLLFVRVPTALHVSRAPPITWIIWVCSEASALHTAAP